MSDRPDAPFDLVSFGETMVAFVSRDGGHDYLAVTAGAESNVAAGMAQLGCRVRWVSRLGDDPLGTFVESSIAARGVDVAVVRDRTRPTGVLTKHVTEAGTRIQYYRSQSAARGLSADDLARVGPTRRIHVTGITPALSPSAAEMVAAVAERRLGAEVRVSFDVNLRRVLWPDLATAAETITALCLQADVVFLGDDEAEALFGTSQPGPLADLLLRRQDQELVLKRGAAGASVVDSTGTVFVPGLPAEVVDPTGAGDAFAAGYLAGECYGWPAAARLRLGHLMGSRVVGVLDDIPPPLDTDDLQALSAESLAARWEGIIP